MPSFVGELVMFLPEPQNPYDSNAVAIVRLRDHGSHLGYLPRVDQHLYVKGQIQFGRISECGSWTLGGTYSQREETAFARVLATL